MGGVITAHRSGMRGQEWGIETRFSSISTRSILEQETHSCVCLILHPSILVLD
jgi:hypothetical protein